MPPLTTPMARRTASGSRCDVVAGDRRPPAVGPQQRRQHPQGGRLAGAVRAEEAEDLAGGDVEGDVVDGDHVVEALRESLDLDHPISLRP
jgi:hypothetical protein